MIKLYDVLTVIMVVLFISLIMRGTYLVLNGEITPTISCEKEVCKCQN